MGYKNFKVAIYCRVGDLNNIKDLDKFREDFKFFEKHLSVDKVYLETFRGSENITRERMLEFKAFFKEKGIKTSGGITTLPAEEHKGFDSMCYSNEQHRKLLKATVEFTAEIFDEIILDDFYFTNCKCEGCIKEKGERSWTEFRLAQMKQVSEELVVKPAKKINPNINMIIKYPNWYEHYQDAGYNLEDEPKIFDMIYTGTETRDPQYTQQHLPKYLSYFLMRYLENVKPGKNAGGWFDPYECNYNLGYYIEQAILTLLGKTKEVTLFCLESLLEQGGSLFIPMVGHIFSKLDENLQLLENPTGTACYLPYHSSGEDFLHNYVGMLGIPLEPYPYYPEQAKTVFLTENASKDEEIVGKIKSSLIKGSDVIITSGLLTALQDSGLDQICKIRDKGKKAKVDRYGVSHLGISYSKFTNSGKSINIPQLVYSTNDTWALISALGEENNFPVLLKVSYGKGRLFVLTIPEDFGDIYNYPKEVINSIRTVFQKDSFISLDARSKIGLFTYSNESFALESFLPFQEEVSVIVNKPEAKLINLETGAELPGQKVDEKTIFKFTMNPTTYKLFKVK